MTEKETTFKEASILFILLLLVISGLIVGAGLPAHVAILLALSIVISFARYKKRAWSFIFDGIQEGIVPGIVPILIFMLIGALIGIWIVAGTIPTIMVYGFKVLSAKYFLPTIFILCGIVGGAVGSAFTTVSTVGIAFLGMGQMLGFNPALVTGAIVSGAYCGNALSPLSDTGNLASAISEVDLFQHIKNEFWTVGPAAILSLLFFFFQGAPKSANLQNDTLAQMTATLIKNYTISPLTLLPVAVLFVAAWKKIPAVPSLLVSIVTAIIVRYLFHPHTSLMMIGHLLQEGHVAHTGVASVDALLTRGGIQSMMWSVSLIILALALGGLLVKLKIIEVILAKLEKHLNTPFHLVFVTVMSSLGINVMIGEQYLSIILPGKAFQGQFKRLHLPRKQLSRTLADAGATVNPLIPWGVSGVFIASTLGVGTLQYLPFAVFCYLTPLMTLLLSLKKTSDA